MLRAYQLRYEPAAPISTCGAKRDEHTERIGPLSSPAISSADSSLAARAVASDAVADAVDATEFLGIHVDQFAGPLALVADDGRGSSARKRPSQSRRGTTPTVRMGRPSCPRSPVPTATGGAAPRSRFRQKRRAAQGSNAAATTGQPDWPPLRFADCAKRICRCRARLVSVRPVRCGDRHLR